MGQQLEIAFVDGMKVGLGYDMLTGTANKSPVVTGTSVTAPAQAGGPVTKLTLAIVQDNESFKKTLGVHADASGSYMGFEANAKFDFAESCSVSKFCTYVVIGVSVTNATKTIDNPQLTDEANTLLKIPNFSRFRERFGDRWISGIKTGGEYYAVYQVQSFDEEERSSIASEIQASFNDIVASAKLDVSISQSKSSSKNRLEINVSVYQAGALTKSDTDLASMLEKARNFPILVSGEQAAPYSIIVDEYSELALPLDKFNPIDIQKQRETLAFNGNLLTGFKQMINDIDFIRKNIDRFQNADGTPPDDSDLQKKRAECVGILDKIQSQASKCSVNPDLCERITEAPEDYSNQFPIPKPPIKDSPLPQPKAVKVPNFIGMEVNDFRDGADTSGLLIQLVQGEGRTGHDGAAGVVYMQEPPAGVPALTGSTVTLTCYSDNN